MINSLQSTQYDESFLSKRVVHEGLPWNDFHSSSNDIHVLAYQPSIAQRLSKKFKLSHHPAVPISNFQLFVPQWSDHSLRSTHFLMLPTFFKFKFDESKQDSFYYTVAKPSFLNDFLTYSIALPFFIYDKNFTTRNRLLLQYWFP